ncbi:MAG TPA: helix-turn-helix domain-containing protein [Steroidobacteraceae bacterium]|jgi:AcrR family transcriptional regulator|nr:helix-turn-helix domain-containing protein [Steroidobacteraceae bacterium]
MVKIVRTRPSADPNVRLRQRDPRALGRKDWVNAARRMLIAKGVERVRVDALARALEISRGSFYWHFASRRALLDALLEDWRARNTAPFVAIAADEGMSGEEKFRALADVWLDESDYDPAYDAAIRDWARTSARVAARVRRVDRERIDLLAKICRDLGYARREAEIRARITYFHQVGYYALGLKESGRVRRRLAPIYTRILLG